MCSIAKLLYRSIAGIAKFQANSSCSFMYSVMSSLGLHAHKTVVIGIKCGAVSTQEYTFCPISRARGTPASATGALTGPSHKSTPCDAMRCGAMRLSKSAEPAACAEIVSTFPKHPCHQCRLSWGKLGPCYLCASRLWLQAFR